MNPSTKWHVCEHFFLESSQLQLQPLTARQTLESMTSSSVAVPQPCARNTSRQAGNCYSVNWTEPAAVSWVRSTNVKVLKWQNVLASIRTRPSVVTKTGRCCEEIISEQNVLQASVTTTWSCRRIQIRQHDRCVSTSFLDCCVVGGRRKRLNLIDSSWPSDVLLLPAVGPWLAFRPWRSHWLHNQTNLRLLDAARIAP